MKKLFTSLTCVMLLSSAIGFAYEEPPINLVLDDLPIKTDVPPTIKRNITYVPIGFIAKELGATVEWNDPKITITMDDLKLELEIGRMQVMRNGKGYPMMAAPYLSEGRTMVPLRVVSNQLGCTVAFDNSAKNKVIRLTKTDNKFVPPPAIDVEGFEESPDGKWGVKYVDYNYDKTLYLMDNSTETLYEIYTDISIEGKGSSITPAEQWVGDNRLLFYGSTDANGKKGGIYLMLYNPTTKKISYIDKTDTRAGYYVKEKNAFIYIKVVGGDAVITDSQKGKDTYYLYNLENNTSTKISEKEYDKLKKMVDPDSD